MFLDSDKAQTFRCSDCDVRLRRLRNCDGKGSPGKNLLNGRIYPRCPKATFLEQGEAVLFVRTYFDCRDSKCWPFPGSRLFQSCFTVSAFDYLDGLVLERQKKDREKHDAAAKAEAEKAKRRK